MRQSRRSPSLILRKAFERATMNRTTANMLNERIIANRECTEAYLKGVFSCDDPLLSTIFSAMDYSLQAGGKRIRPFLTLEVCRMLGKDPSVALPLACAVEMIHTYSLIHDDLPCMDNDDLRRGKPTNHKVYGEAVATLAGDGLLTHAFGVVLKADIPTDAAIKCIGMMSEASGACGMIGGQIIDIESENKHIDIDTLRAMHRLKTGALIKLSALLGCIAAGYGEDTAEYRAVEAYSEKLGTVFQIVDDILDVTSDDLTLGKRVGSDGKNGKTTFLTFYTVEEARSLAKELTDSAISDIAEYDKKNGGVLGAFAEYLCERVS